MSDRPATWQDEQAAVEAAFERSGVARTWPDDEPDQMVPMVNAMADEIARLQDAVRRWCEPCAVKMSAILTDDEQESMELAADYAESQGEDRIASDIRGLLERLK